MIREYLKDYGYSDEQIEKILEHNKLNTLKDSSLLKIIPRTIECLESLGYSNKQIIKLTSSIPPILGHSEENLRTKVEDLEALGYRRSQIIRMSTNFASVFTYSISTMKQRISDIESLGYTRREVLRMTLELPSLYGRSIENLVTKIHAIEGLGYSRDEVLRMTSLLPSLFSYSIENIKEKIDFARQVELEQALLDNPKNLMQSVDLTYARYKFLTEECVFLDEEVSQEIFRNAEHFKSKFKISKKELLEKYSYGRDVRRLNLAKND